jgi:hypothetical protein
MVMALEGRELLSTLTVSNTGDSGPGSLRAAVAQANSDGGGDTIVFSSLFNSPNTIILTGGQLELTGTKARTTITGPGANLLSVSGNNARRVFQVDHGVTATISGLTISGGMANTFGGGLDNQGGDATLTDCRVEQNTANEWGGGLANAAGSMLILNNCTVAFNSVPTGASENFGLGGGLWNTGTATLTDCGFASNKGTLGSGLFNDREGVLSLTSVKVMHNTASEGAGLFNRGGNATLTDCTVSGNKASPQGGGLYNAVGGTLSLTGCMVSDNTATGFTHPFGESGGGGLFSLGTTTLTDCTVSGNSGDENGGGLFVFAGTTTLTDCTVSGNSANRGGGLRSVISTLTLTNCTISGNFAEYGAGLYSQSGATTTLTNTIVAGNNGGGDVDGSISGSNNLIGGNPLLAPLGDYGGPTQTLALLPGSPAIGGGAPGADIPKTDQRGFARGSSLDIGAYQSQGFTLSPVASSTPQAATVGTKFAKSLDVTVTAKNVGQFVNPVDGGVIGFSAPSAGASATLSAASAVIAGGQVSVTATANATPGTYAATATAVGAASIDFNLTNTEALGLGPPAPRDVVLEFDDLITLRKAIAYSNSHPGPATITFDPPVFSKRPRTITLKGAPLVVTNPATTTIIGPGARRLTIQGDGKSRVFDIEGGSLALERMTITGGRANRGDGILNDGGRLALDHVVLRGNRARVGGGLFNDGTAALSDVVIRGNSALMNCGLFSTRRATLTWSRSPTERIG